MRDIDIDGIKSSSIHIQNCMWLLYKLQNCGHHETEFILIDGSLTSGLSTIEGSSWGCTSRVFVPLDNKSGRLDMVTNSLSWFSSRKDGEWVGKLRGSVFCLMEVFIGIGWGCMVNSWNDGEVSQFDDELDESVMSEKVNESSAKTKQNV